ncbi:mercuric transporter MerT family protein [Oricola cellulosilytica]|uniref:Mercuric transport protein MerT n=1 Tax=Oricola cellulosilytica TaxID=1429082 RepID=A0A4R0PEJ7_9HYPH|nr:mercuric transporter MerT family protein [Oricola cellulosilytica]TCD16226.1 mercury transporter MerT [Oricola cellulosilytica]
MHEITDATFNEAAAGDDAPRTRLVAAGGVLGAIAASACCIVPLVLFSLGVSGAWIGQLTALSPYQPIFIAITAGFLGYGYWLVYRKPKAACAEGEACARPLPNRLVKSALWFATALVLLAFAWPYLVPFILG